jgi:hypothetical protein
MREIRQSGSEGGATTAVPTPIRARTYERPTFPLDFAPTELTTFFASRAIKIWLLWSRV